MSKSKKSKIYNAIFIIVIALLIIPQTRQPIQVFFNKGMAAVVKPSVINTSERKLITDYNWTLKDISGNDFNFENAKGKVVILNFWATWCPPCIAEMPSLEALYKDYKHNDNVLFLFVSNEETSVIGDFISKHNYTFNVYQSVSNYPKLFNVSSIPRTFVVDKSGAIVIDKSGAANWNSNTVRKTVDDLLKAF